MSRHEEAKRIATIWLTVWAVPAAVRMLSQGTFGAELILALMALPVYLFLKEVASRVPDE